MQFFLSSLFQENGIHNNICRVNKAYNILFINPKKNFHVLLPLLQHQPDLKLVIAGNDSHAYVNLIKEKALALGVLSFSSSESSL